MSLFHHLFHLFFCIFVNIEIYHGRHSYISSFGCYNYWTYFFKKCVIRGIVQGRSPFLESKKVGFKKVYSKNQQAKKCVGLKKFGRDQYLVVIFVTKHIWMDIIMDGVWKQIWMPKWCALGGSRYDCQDIYWQPKASYGMNQSYPSITIFITFNSNFKQKTIFFGKRANSQSYLLILKTHK